MPNTTVADRLESYFKLISFSSYLNNEYVSIVSWRLESQQLAWASKGPFKAILSAIIAITSSMTSKIIIKAIVDYTSPALCTPVTLFPPTGDAAYRQQAGGGPSHGRGQHAQKFRKDRACGSGDILSDRQTHRQTHSSQYCATAPAGEVKYRDFCSGND